MGTQVSLPTSKGPAHNRNSVTISRELLAHRSLDRSVRSIHGSSSGYINLSDPVPLQWEAQQRLHSAGSWAGRARTCTAAVSRVGCTRRSSMRSWLQSSPGMKMFCFRRLSLKSGCGKLSLTWRNWTVSLSSNESQHPSQTRSCSGRLRAPTGDAPGHPRTGSQCDSTQPPARVSDASHTPSLL